MITILLLYFDLIYNVIWYVRHIRMALWGSETKTGQYNRLLPNVEMGRCGTIHFFAVVVLVICWQNQSQEAKAKSMWGNGVNRILFLFVSPLHTLCNSLIFTPLRYGWNHLSIDQGQIESRCLWPSKRIEYHFIHNANHMPIIDRTSTQTMMMMIACRSF